MLLWPPRWRGAQEQVEKQRATAARKAMDVARGNLQVNIVGQSRVRRLIEYTRRRVIMCRMGAEIAEGGKLVGLPSHHSHLLL